jgi:hypothetical protein
MLFINYGIKKIDFGGALSLAVWMSPSEVCFRSLQGVIVRCNNNRSSRSTLGTTMVDRRSSHFCLIFFHIQDGGQETIASRSSITSLLQYASACIQNRCKGDLYCSRDAIVFETVHRKNIFLVGWNYCSISFVQCCYLLGVLCSMV